MSDRDQSPKLADYLSSRTSLNDVAGSERRLEAEVRSQSAATLVGTAQSEGDSDHLDKCLKPGEQKVGLGRKPRMSIYEREVWEENERANMTYAERKMFRSSGRKSRRETQSTQDDIRVYIVTFARALMTFGVPAHSIESQINAMAYKLALRAKMHYYSLPSAMNIVFKEEEDYSQVYQIKQGGHNDFTCLAAVHDLNKNVGDETISPKDAVTELKRIMCEKAIYANWQLCLFSLLASAIICPLAFGGSIIDAAVAGFIALLVRCFTCYAAPRLQRLKPVHEHVVALAIAFTVRGISSIRGNILCYSAISSSSIISLLPGYMLLVSSLEMGSGSVNSGSMKMVRTLLYTVVLGFSLKLGSDTFLDLDPSARNEVKALSTLSSAVTQSGIWTAQNGTGLAPIANGPFSLVQTNTTALAEIHIGCYRSPDFRWYLQPFPVWTQFFLVPSFSLLLCLLNMQKFWSSGTLMMIVISSAAYATNSAGNHFFFGTRAYIVSAIGAQTVSLLGNLFSMWTHRPALALMIPGMLLLVPSGLSAAGGIAADDDNFTQFTNAMLHVVIGIQVGLALNQFFFAIFKSKRGGTSHLTL